MSEPSSPAAGRELHAQASVWMERGIALLNAGPADTLPEALRCFDEAIALRRRLPLAENPGLRYGLAAGWIHRGDALTRLGGDARLTSAIQAYTTAIALLQEDIPATDDGSYTRRLAIAWLNRGVALEAQNTAPALAEAVHSYREVVRLLDHSPRTAGTPHLHILAGGWINLGNAELRAAGSAGADRTCTAIENALSLLAKTEAQEPPAAEAGLKARHIFCQAILAVLADPTHDPSREIDLIGRITDTVEDALALAEHWEKTGLTRFHPMATQLFQLGALVYEQHQPQFLAEYLLEHLDPDRAEDRPAASQSWFAIAQASLARARRKIMSGDFAWLATPHGHRRLETLKELQSAEARLPTLPG